MTRVTFLTGEYPPMQGGIADHIACLARELAPLGVESSILISRRWQEASGEPPPVFSVYADIPTWGWRSWPAVLRFLEAHRPGVLHIQYQAAAFDLGGWINWLPWFLKRRGVATRLVTTFHDLRIPYIFPKAGSFRWRSVLALAQHSDAVICTNREDLQTLQQSLVDSPWLAHIPLGSNADPQPPADFDRTVWRRRYRAGPDTLLLAYYGFLNESKGGEELIEALACLRRRGIDACLLLIGGDVGHVDPSNRAYAQKLQILIERLGLAEFVHRTGYVDLPQVSASLLAADVVVMPYRDGVSFRRTTLISALRHGCPVVSTEPAGTIPLPEIRPGENMLLAPPGDVEGLAQAVATIAADAALRQKLASGAKKLGRLFDWDQIARETKELYQTVALL